MTSEQLATLLKRIRRRRGAVSGCVAQRAAGGARNGADAALVSCGFRPLGKAWIELEESEARLVLRNLLQKDLAYGSRRMGLEDADAYAMEFMSIPDPPRRYFTNGSWLQWFEAIHAGARNRAVGFTGVTDSTFDAGLAAVGGSLAAVLWVQDED